MVRIEIDDNKGTVERIRGYSFFQKKERYELCRFESVRLSETAIAIEEGYLRILYSVYLEAPGSCCELIATYDENRARSLHRELAELLRQIKARRE